MIDRFSLSEHLVQSRETTLYLYSLSEAEIQNVSDALIGKLYKNALDKYNYIDFGDIPDSKGDFTRFKGYKINKDAIQNLDDLAKRCGITNFKELETVKQTVEILERYKVEFTAGYLNDIEIIKFIYNTTVYSVIASINLLISDMINYIKNPVKGVEIKIDTNHKDYIMLSSLDKFNQAEKKHELTKIFTVTKNKEKFLGLTFGGSVLTILGAAYIIVPVMRQLIFSFYDIRMTVSEYLLQQSEFIRLNSDIVKSSSDTKIDKKKVAKNQIKTAERLEKLSNKIAVKFEENDKKAKKELSKKIDVKDINDPFASTDNGFGGLM